MAPPYQLVFADLDGTLVDSEGRISERTSSTLARIQSAGCILVICTGRSRHAASRIVQGIHGSRYGIVLNGAVVLNWQTGEILQSCLLPGAATELAVELAKRHGLAPVWMGIEDRDSFKYVQPGPSLWPEYEKRNHADILHVNDFGSLPQAPASIVAYGPREQALLLAHEWQSRLGSEVLAVAGPTAVYRGWYAQLTAADADKANAAAFLANHIGVQREQTLAIGDHSNDITLLRWAGLGICMGDGHPEAQAAADHIAGAHFEDGAAIALEQFVLSMASPGADLPSREIDIQCDLC